MGTLNGKYYSEALTVSVLFVQNPKETKTSANNYEYDSFSSEFLMPVAQPGPPPKPHHKIFTD